MARALPLLFVAMAALVACSASPPAAVTVAAQAPAASAPAASAPTPSDAGAAPASPGHDAGRPPMPPGARKTRVELQDVKAPGFGDPMKVTLAIRPGLASCFEAAARETELRGTIVLRAKVDGAGKVTAVKMEDELGLDVDLAACLVNALRAATLPAPSGGGTLTIPIRVSPP